MKVTKTKRVFLDETELKDAVLMYLLHVAKIDVDDLKCDQVELRHREYQDGIDEYDCYTKYECEVIFSDAEI